MKNRRSGRPSESTQEALNSLLTHWLTCFEQFSMISSKISPDLLLHDRCSILWATSPLGGKSAERARLKRATICKRLNCRRPSESTQEALNTLLTHWLGCSKPVLRISTKVLLGGPLLRTIFQNLRWAVLMFWGIWATTPQELGGGRGDGQACRQQ